MRVWNGILVVAFLAELGVAWWVFRWNSAEVAAWVSGIGALAAALVALKIASDETKRYTIERQQLRQESLDRAVRRAQRVDVETNLYISEPGGSYDYDVLLVNASTLPIYRVSYHGVLLTFYRSPKKVETYRGGYQVTRDRKSAITLDTPEAFVNPGARWTKEMRFPSRPPLIATDPPTNAPISVVISVSFEDEDGNLFGLISEELAPPAELGLPPTLNRRWALVDENYPDSVESELMRERLAAATAEPIPQPKAR